MGSRNKLILDSFVFYCEKHPEMRFWQALRAWSGFGFIYAGDLQMPKMPDNIKASRELTTEDMQRLVEMTGLKDTFYWEGIKS